MICDLCGGTGRIQKDTCTQCLGHGEKNKIVDTDKRTFNVSITGTITAPLSGKMGISETNLKLEIHADSNFNSMDLLQVMHLISEFADLELQSVAEKLTKEINEVMPELLGEVGDRTIN